MPGCIRLDQRRPALAAVGPGACRLFLGMVIYTACFFLLYPRISAVVDEDAYLTQAYLFRAGHLSYDAAPEIPPPHMVTEHNGRIVSKYPPGTALWLLPFTYLGARSAYVSGLLLALVGTLLFALVLGRVAPQADRSWALLYLCHPAVVILSRTLMSDLLAATAFLAACYCLLSSRHLAAGLLFGFACLTRYSSLVMLPVFLLLLPRDRGSGPALAFLTGLAPFVALIAGYDWFAFGSPLSFPMYLTGNFSPLFVPRNLTYYAGALLLCYPLMLLAPLSAPSGHRLLFLLPAYGTLALYCCFDFIYVAGGLPGRVTLGLRYLAPALPFFVLAYVMLLDRATRAVVTGRLLRPGLVAAVLVVAFLVHWRHDRILAVQEHYRREIYRHLPPAAQLVASAGASELVSYAYGPRRWLPLAAFNVPLLPDLQSGVPTYAALLEKQNQHHTVEQTLFYALVMRYPLRRLIAATDEPWHFRLYRLE